MKKLLLLIIGSVLMLLGCGPKTESANPDATIKTIRYADLSNLYVVAYDGKTYIVHPNGGIVEHTPKKD